MAVNSYFQNGMGQGTSGEVSLVEDNIIELIQMAGFDFYYIPRTLFNEDKFFNEAPNSQYNDYFKFEMYIANAEDFGGQGDLFSKFGLQVDDTADIIFARKRFWEETGLENPSEGDLIYFPLSKHLFEIKFLEDEPGKIGSVGQFYSLSRLYTFCAVCSLYKYSYETFDTGIEEVDTQFNWEDYKPKTEKNSEIDTEAGDYLDFSEDNPFGVTVDRS